jgi:hypothetical protein
MGLIYIKVGGLQLLTPLNNNIKVNLATSTTTMNITYQALNIDLVLYQK